MLMGVLAHHAGSGEGLGFIKIIAQNVTSRGGELI